MNLSKGYDRHYLKGFTLIEVLISLVIAVIGIVAILQLQGVFLSTASDSQQRAMAMAVAEKKLEELRGYDSISTTSSSLNSFDDIDSGTGAETVTAGSTSYTYALAWTVTPYMVSGASVSVASMSNADFKNVTLNVSWDSGASSLSLSSVIGAINPKISKFIDKSGLGGDRPQVDYTPGAAPDIISVDLGDGSKKETSKPLPEVSQKGNSNIVKFETVTYDSNYRLVTEDHLSVNCVCQLNGSGQGLPPAKTVYNATTKSLETDYPLAFVTKTIGATYRQGQLDDQPDICDRCCRDHHDSDGGTDDSYRWYWPRNSTYFNVDDNHRHYSYDSATDTFTEATATGHIYREVCRFKRVDGIYRLMQDWRLVGLTVMPSSYLASGSQGNADYTTYVASYAEALLNTAVSNSERLGDTLPSVAKPTGRDLVSGAMGSVPQGSLTQLLSRGIYVDPLTQESITAIHNIKNSGGGTWLDKIPFYEVNLVLLANWSPDNTSVAEVTNEPVVTIVDPDQDYYGDYSRGLVSAVGTGITSVSAASLITNTGLVGHRDINDISLATDNIFDIAANQLEDGITVEVVGSGLVSGVYSCYSESANNNKCTGQKVPAYSSISVIANGMACSTSSSGWSCTVPDTWSDNVTFSYANGGDPDYKFVDRAVGGPSDAIPNYTLPASVGQASFDILIVIP